MELEQEFLEYIKYKYFLAEKLIKNPSAFTSIYYIKGYIGRYGEVKAVIEKEIHRLQQSVVYEKRIEKRIEDIEVTKITFK